MSLFFGIDWLKGGYLKKYGKDISREQFELLWEINREESLAAEREPADSSWNELCLDEGIVLVWPDVAEARLREKVDEMSRVMNSN